MLLNFLKLSFSVTDRVSKPSKNIFHILSFEQETRLYWFTGLFIVQKILDYDSGIFIFRRVQLITSEKFMEIREDFLVQRLLEFHLVFKLGEWVKSKKTTIRFKSDRDQLSFIFAVLQRGNHAAWYDQLPGLQSCNFVEGRYERRLIRTRFRDNDFVELLHFFSR